MKDTTKKIFMSIVILIIFVLCIALTVIGQRCIGPSGLGMQLLGIAGLVFLLWLYNRQFKLRNRKE